MAAKTQKYTINATLDIEEVIKSESIKGAVDAFRSVYPDAHIDSVNDELVIGYCEHSGQPIFEGDDYKEDSEGVKILSDYYTEGDLGENDAFGQEDSVSDTPEPPTAEEVTAMMKGFVNQISLLHKRASEYMDEFCPIHAPVKAGQYISMQPHWPAQPIERAEVVSVKCINWPMHWNCILNVIEPAREEVKPLPIYLNTEERNWEILNQTTTEL